MEGGEGTKGEVQRPTTRAGGRLAERTRGRGAVSQGSPQDRSTFEGSMNPTTCPVPFALARTPLPPVSRGNRPSAACLHLAASLGSFSSLQHVSHHTLPYRNPLSSGQSPIFLPRPSEHAPTLLCSHLSSPAALGPQIQPHPHPCLWASLNPVPLSKPPLGLVPAVIVRS